MPDFSLRVEGVEVDAIQNVALDAAILQARRFAVENNLTHCTLRTESQFLLGLILIQAGVTVWTWRLVV